MKAILNTRTGFYSIEKAREIAAEVQAGDPDWSYLVVDCENGLGRIDVLDEDGEVVVSGFMA